MEFPALRFSIIHEVYNQEWTCKLEGECTQYLDSFIHWRITRFDLTECQYDATKGLAKVLHNGDGLVHYFFLLTNKINTK